MAATEQRNQLRIAVLLTFEAQMLDLAGIDLFGMVSKEYLLATLPKPIVSLGLDVKVREKRRWSRSRALASEYNASLNIDDFNC